MKRVLVLVAIASLAHGDTPMQLQIEALTAIDVVPTTDQLNKVFGAPVSDLTGFALDTTRNAGVRLRAIHALVNYCTPPLMQCDQAPAHAPLMQLVNDNAMATSGPDLLMLRAAIESLGPMQVATDGDLLTPLLNHPSRDVRATTALALGDLCNTSANVVAALRTRLQNEGIDQVRLAISSALRALNQCPVTP